MCCEQNNPHLYLTSGLRTKHLTVRGNNRPSAMHKVFLALCIHARVNHLFRGVRFILLRINLRGSRANTGDLVGHETRVRRPPLLVPCCVPWKQRWFCRLLLPSSHSYPSCRKFFYVLCDSFQRNFGACIVVDRQEQQICRRQSNQVELVLIPDTENIFTTLCRKRRFGDMFSFYECEWAMTFEVKMSTQNHPAQQRSHVFTFLFRGTDNAP